MEGGHLDDTPFQGIAGRQHIGACRRLRQYTEFFLNL
jgi:hypothetical protein